MSFPRNLWKQEQENNDPPADKPQIKNYLEKIGQGQPQPQPTVMETSREELLLLCQNKQQTSSAFPNSGGNLNTFPFDRTSESQHISRMYGYNLPQPIGTSPFNLIRSVVPNVVSGNPNVRPQSFEGHFRNNCSIELSIPQPTGDHNGNTNLLNAHQINNPMFMRNSFAGTNNISSNWVSKNAVGDTERDDGSNSFRIMGQQLNIKENLAALPYKMPSDLPSYDLNISKSAQRNPIGPITPPIITHMTPSYRMTLRKKVALNNFPSNVKSLLLSGLFDGIPVKYISWSRKENLRGIIKSSGYLCGCNDCKFNNVVNAYAFEIHAGCQTKHPNNHIYFQNGKTIYDVVHELKESTPYSIFQTIKTVTGSPINMKNFRTWKGKYVAATATQDIIRSS